MNNKHKLLFIFGIVTIAIMFRMIPQEFKPPNMAPIGAIALFCGATIADKRVAYILPLAAMFISDLYIGFHNSMLWVYGAIAIITLYSTWSGRNNLVRGSLVASLVFFTITNFGSWVASGMYAYTVEGLIRCYAMGIPFFHYTVLSDLLFSGFLFGSLILYESMAAMMFAYNSRGVDG